MASGVAANGMFWCAASPAITSTCSRRPPSNAAHGSLSSSHLRRTALGEFGELQPEQLADQHVLRGEVAVERADANAGAPRDVLHLGLLTVLGERLASGIEDALAVAERVGAHRGGHLALIVA